MGAPARYKKAMASVTPATPEQTTDQVARVVAALAAGVLGSDHGPAVPERVLATLGLLPSRQDRDKLVNALRLLGSPLGALALTGSPAPVPERSREAAEVLLQRWWRSRLRPLRQIAGALTAAALSAEYSFPAPALERIGYPGPLGPPPEAPKRLSPIQIEADERLVCDVVVVGSGAGSDLFVSGEVEASLEAVAERLGVTGEASRPGARDELMEAGLRKLGWHVDGMPRNVRGCSQDAACGFCGFGCRLGAKQSTMRTYLEDAAERGTRL